MKEVLQINTKLIKFFLGKCINTSLNVKNSISKLDLGNGYTPETADQKSQALNLIFSTVFSK